MRTHRISPLILAAALAFFPGGCSKSPDSSNGGASSPAPATGGKKKFAYITNGIDPFWNTAVAGVRAAEKELGVECEVFMPPKGIVDQKRMVETVLARGIDGIAISPIDAKNEVDLINDACSRAPLITQDSDAPGSKRLCFVGMDNYKAGRAAGRLVKEAIPAGGKVMLFVGRLEQLNAQQRRQGIVDELLDRPTQTLDKLTIDPAGQPLKGDKYTIVDTRLDNFDFSRAKANAEDALSAYPDLACMIGLFAYNTPACMEAVKGAHKMGQVKFVSFDENAAVLQGIKDGDVHGTISQQPYLYGYHSVRILNGLANGDKSVVPANGVFDVSIIEVRKANVDEFWENLKKQQAAGK